MLPPLATSEDLSDGSMGKMQRQTTFGSSFHINELVFARPNFRQRRLSVAVDKKVVTHLRRQLNRRLEKRVNQLLEEELGDNISQRHHVHDEFDQQVSFRSKRGWSHAFRTKASVSEPEVKEPAQNALPSICTASEPTDHFEMHREAMASTIDPLPIVHSQKSAAAETKDDDEMEPEIVEVLSESHMDEKLVRVPEVEVSPVPTPFMFRPETRDHTRLSLKEKVKRILTGSLCTSFIPDKKIVTLFINGHCTDSDGERSILLERVLPNLHTLVSGSGYTLRVIDPHWGVKHFVSDNHVEQELIVRLIEKAITNTRGINFVSFLGQKYGEPVLPSVIPKSEFDIIKAAVEQDYLKEVQAAAAAAAVVEENRKKQEEVRKLNPALVKKGRQLLDLEEEEDFANEDVKDDAECSDVDHEFDSDDEHSDNPLSADSRDRADVAFTKNDNGSVDTQSANRPMSVNFSQECPSLQRKVRAKFRKISIGAGKESIASKMFQRESLPSEKRSQVDPALLRSCYLLDTNVVPAAYRLQPISSQFKDFTKNDVNKRQAASEQWLQTAAALRNMLCTYAEKLLEPYSARKYSTSLMELELQHGILWNPQDPVAHTFWFRRDIEDLHYHLDDPLSRDYIDVQSSYSQPNHTLVQVPGDLRDSKLEQMLPKQCVWKYPVNWSSKGISSSSTRSHSIYLDRMRKEFSKVVSNSLISAFQRDTDRLDMTSHLFREVVQHVTICQEKARSFHGRKQLLQHLKIYIRSPHRHPMVVYGGIGSGKTALLAKAARDTAKWLKGVTPVVIFRTVGLTPASSSLRLILRDICRQMSEIYDDEYSEAAHDQKGLVNDFNFKLTKGSEMRPLILYIDGVNLLADEDDAKKMTWIPQDLPPHVKLVVSTLKDNDYYPALQKAFATQEDVFFLEVSELHISDAVTILEHWLHADGRTVTKQQLDMLLEHFQQCPMPLYLRLVYYEASHWPSYLPTVDIKLGSTVKKLAVNLFGRLEKEHGEPLVRRALGYITASKNGLTDTEMEDLLSLDEVVLDDIYAHYKPTLRRLPQLYWLRLRADMDNYLVETITDNTVTLRWFHHQFAEAATERYLNQRDKAPSYHKALAEYFLDLWSETPKPNPNGAAQLRYVVPQPLFYQSTVSDGGCGKRRVYNLRRLMELPFQLLRSQQMDLLKKQCLCNFDFLLAKISSISLRSVFDDFQMTFLAEPAESSVRMLSDTLFLSANVLNADPQQLASQLVGRLHGIVTSDIPVAPADPVKYPYLKPLFKSVLKSTQPALLPSATCLTPPGGILFDLLYGHSEPITAVVSTADGQRAITTSKDNTLKLWELRSRRVIKTIQGVGSNVFSIRLGAGNALVVTSEVDRIRVWSLQSGALVRDITDYDDPANVTIATEANLLAAFFDGCRKLRVFSLANDGVRLMKEVDLSDEDNIHVDNSFLVSQNTHGVQVLYAFRSGSSAYVRNIKSCKRIHKFYLTGSATAVATSREYFLVAVRLQYMKLHEISQMELYDMRSGQFIRTVRGCTADNIRELHINQLGSHALVISSSEANNTSDIAVWNIETEDHKHLAKHSNVSNFGACVDVRYCLTVSPNENSLRIWNLTSKINVPVPKSKQNEGLEKLISIPGHPQYIIAKSLLNGPLTVWNIRKKKFAGMVVRSMTGIMDVNDVMVVKDTKLMILTDKGFSNVSAINCPVYQTILVYDLIEAKFTNKITGCYITPSQPHEYVILNDNQFLGLSDTRSHFVIWSLKTGHVDYRIKTNFRMEDSGNEVDDFGACKKKDLTIKRQHNMTACMAPWDRRAETMTARQRRHNTEIEHERERLDGIKKEKDNAIEQFIISKDFSTIVASYYSHHLCVFDLSAKCHHLTLEDESSMLLLHVAALTVSGSHLVLANYDDDNKISYLTLWSCRNGTIRRRLRNEKNVCCIAISDDASRVVFGKTNCELRIWDPAGRPSATMQRIHGYSGLNLSVDSQIYIIEGGQRAVVYAGDISVWDLEARCVLSVFTPDMTIQGFTVAMNGHMLAFGLRDRSDIITLRLTGNDMQHVDLKKGGQNVFGEGDSSSDEEEDGDEKEDDDEESIY